MSWDRGRTLANANAMTITINATKAVPLPMPASALDFPRMRPSLRTDITQRDHARNDCGNRREVAKTAP